MNITGMKNIIVLKNLPSNIVEEAIVVLKSSKRVKKIEYIDKKTEKPYIENEKSDDYILKEAESVVSNFISNMEKSKDENSQTIKNVMKKYKTLKIVTILLSSIMIINILLKLFS